MSFGLSNSFWRPDVLFSRFRPCRWLFAELYTYIAWYFVDSCMPSLRFGISLRGYSYSKCHMASRCRNSLSRMMLSTEVDYDKQILEIRESEAGGTRTRGVSQNWWFRIPATRGYQNASVNTTVNTLRFRVPWWWLNASSKLFSCTREAYQNYAFGLTGADSSVSKQKLSTTLAIRVHVIYKQIVIVSRREENHRVPHLHHLRESWFINRESRGIYELL